MTLRERLVAVRARYEALVRLYTAYERLFSPQIVCGLINNGLIIFASVASFFKMGESAYWHGIHVLSCAGYLFIIVVMSLFPIHLHEEVREEGTSFLVGIHVNEQINKKSINQSINLMVYTSFAPLIKSNNQATNTECQRPFISQSLQTTELLQDVIYKYQTIQHDPADRGISRELKETGTEDFFLLYGFLQRTITKPLVVSAGGFVELTRSFIVSVRTEICAFNTRQKRMQIYKATIYWKEKRALWVFFSTFFAAGGADCRIHSVSAGAIRGTPATDQLPTEWHGDQSSQSLQQCHCDRSIKPNKYLLARRGGPLAHLRSLTDESLLLLKFIPWNFWFDQTKPKHFKTHGKKFWNFMSQWSVWVGPPTGPLAGLL